MWRALKEFFLRGPRLPLHFMLTSRALACLSLGKGEKRAVSGRAVLSLPAGCLAPSFDFSNVRNAAELARLVPEAVRLARASGREASLLLPEACQKSFVLAFESLPSSPEERQALIFWRLKKQMPSLPEDVRLSYDAAADGSPRRVFVTLARAAVVREYEEVFASSGIKLRNIGLPTLGLLNLLDRNRERDVLLANVEEDAIGLLGVFDGRAVLYRFKPFLSGKGFSPQDLTAAAGKELAGTLRFLEGREKKTVKTVWVRAGTGGDAQEIADGLQAVTTLPVRLLDAPASCGLKPRERHFLAPLIGLSS
ncbi:MAG: hypothetical protein JW747_09575 [Candidatus Aminicenantes bacterium]|nr:hypothetical protein [Candidatus Aminicenantes bacterium]